MTSTDTATDAPAELVHLDVVRGVATITLDSPGNRNALSRQVRAELLAHVQAALADDAVRVLLLTHTGSVFCSGMDLKETRAASTQDQGVNELPRLLQLLQTSPKPVVVRLGGTARAGGVGLVAAADIAVAADSTTYAFSEVRLGVVPAVISVPVLPLLQPRAARELFLTGEVFDAARAVQIGLLSRAVPADDLDAEVDRVLESLRLGGPTAMAATKELLGTAATGSLEQQYARMQELSAARFASEEGQEGARAFAEKRRPSWVE